MRAVPEPRACAAATRRASAAALGGWWGGAGQGGKFLFARADDLDPVGVSVISPHQAGNVLSYVEMAAVAGGVEVGAVGLAVPLVVENRGARSPTLGAASAWNWHRTRMISSPTR
nr:hypothetical protein GCM10010200_016540 [Actinomadura rugatobispora]